MPKSTFFHLSKEKQGLLIAAAKKEFSRVPLYEASISNIIKDAGIPRGSFYQYFEDKEDLFFYLLEDHSKQNNEVFISYLKMNNGDLFAAYIDWFKSIFINLENPESRQYFKNTFLNMNYKIERTFTKNMYEERINSGHINFENWNITNEEEKYHVVRIMNAVMFHNLIHALAQELPIHEAIKNFSFEIDLLKKGFCKNPTA